MRVGLITYALDRRPTGIGRYTIELIRALHNLPDKPDITLFASGGIEPLADLNLPHISLTASKLLPGLMTIGQMMIRDAVRRHPVDIIHDLSGVTPMFFGWQRTKRVVTIHDVIPWRYPHTSTRLDRLIYRHYLPHVLPRIDAVATVSECSQSDITHFFRVSPEKVHTTPEGVARYFVPANADTVERVKQLYQINQPYLLCVGALQPRKNLPMVLEAFARIQAEIPHQLVIVGSRNHPTSLISETIERLKLHDRVLFTGYMPDEDLPALYTGAHAFVFPSLYEGFGLPVLEAMACGTPVITSNTSSLPEVAGDAALLVSPDNCDELVHALRRLITDTDLHSGLRKRGMAHVANFTWERTARETLRIYHQVLGT